MQKILSARGAGSVGFSVERPEDLVNGDLTTNVGLTAAKTLKTNPKKLAEEIAGDIRAANIAGVAAVEVAGPGFINIFLTREYFSEILAEAVNNKDFGWSTADKKEKVMVEYTDPNPFKEFHIGHLMSNTIGESVSRLFQAQGVDVKRACYQGDVGLHVAKAIWGMQSVPNRDKSPLKNLGLEAQARYLGHAYALGAAAYEDGHKEDIEKLNHKIYERSDSEVNTFYDWGRKVSLDYFEMQYKRLDTKFDFYFFESEAGPTGMKVVNEGLKKKIFEKSDGAVVFHAQKHDPKLHTRVFINSQGIPTYEAKELGLAEMKYEQWKYDRSVVVTGNEVNDYFRVLLAAMKLVLPKLAEKTVHISHGMLRLPSGKMSSRSGDIITADALIARISDLVREKIVDRGYSDTEKEEITEQVSIAALKYFILKQSIGSDIVFDFEKSVSLEGDSGPYLQYAATRAQSVLKKAQEAKVAASATAALAALEPISDVERLIAHFPDIVARAASELSPNIIATYLLELSSAFNRYYGERQIADAKEKTAPYRVALTRSFKTVMTNGLWLLGIKVPEKM